jgi:hypothetical protein
LSDTGGAVAYLHLAGRLWLSSLGRR